MKKLLTLSLLAWALCVNAQEDVTSQYVKNPSFEQDDISKLTAVNNSADGLRGYTLTNPTGWTVSGTEVTELLVSKDCYTDNNFGKKDGDRAINNSTDFAMYLLEVGHVATVGGDENAGGCARPPASQG